MGCQKRPGSLRAEFAANIALAGVTGAVALFSGTATAETTGAALPADTQEPIVVQASRPGANPYADPQAPYRVTRSANGLLTEDLQDTPKTVVVLPKELLDDLGATAFRDIFRAQPGVTLGTGEGGNAFGDRVFIRGFDARNDIYIDGVRDPGVGTRETFATQQIEILKGPSGAFGGRGTTGGAVSLVSKQPDDADNADLDVTAGTDKLRRVAIDVNRKLGDTLAVRVNLMDQDADTPGRDYVKSSRWGAAIAVAWTPAAPLRVGFDYYHLSTDFLPDWGLPYDVANNRPFAVNRTNFYGVLARDFGETYSDIYTGTVDYAANAHVKFHSILRYGQSKNAYTASAPEQPNAIARTVSANAKRRDAITGSWTGQGNVTVTFDTSGVGHTVVAGYEIAREETLNRTRAFTECAVLPCTGAAANPLLNLDHPDATIPFGRNTAVTARPTIAVDTRAVYALDTVKLSPHWQALIGVRYDDYRAKTEDLTPERRSKSTYFNYQGGIVYKPQDAASLYLSVATSANPACEQLDAFAVDYGGCDQRLVALDPTENTSVELGGKINIGGHFDLTAALFQVDRTGVPVTVGAGAAAAIGLQDQRVTGFELTGAGNITEAWSVFGGLTVIDPRIVKSPIAGQGGGLFPNVSERSFALTNRYQFTDRLYAGATANYNSKKYGGTVIGGSTYVPDYWRFDLFGGFDVTDDVKLSFNVLNLTDKTYFDALYRSATPFTYIAPGRSASVTLDIDF